MNPKTPSSENMSPQEKRELLEKLLREKAAKNINSQAVTDASKHQHAQNAQHLLIQPLSRDQKYFPLSSTQQRLWISDQFDPGNPIYNIPILVRLKGEINLTALEVSLTKILQRHEILRANFTSIDGKPVQFLVPDRTLKLTLFDLRDEPVTTRLAQAKKLMEENARQAFDLSKDPLIRANLFKLADNDHFFQLVIHHIVFDGWSLGLFNQELVFLYTALSRGEEANLPPLPIQYIDYAGWEAGQIENGDFNEQLNYWKNKLGGDLPILEMPLDQPRADFQSFRAEKELLDISPELTRALNMIGRQDGATLFMTMLAVFKVLLARNTGQEDILVGTPIARRSSPEAEKLIGPFLNNLVLRTDLSGNISFRELLKRVRRTALDAFAHQEIPFEKLLGELRFERDSNRTPIFQVYFNLLDVRYGTDIKLPNLSIETTSLAELGSIFDLTLYVQNWGDTLGLKLVYNADLFHKERMIEFLQRYHHLLEQIVADPDQRIFDIPLTSQTKQIPSSISENLSHLINGFTEFKKANIWQSISNRFEQQVEKFPHNLAVKTQHFQWNYEQLNRIANHVAHGILKHRVQTNERVALLFDHDAPMIAGLFGALKAGKTYIPLDPQYPQERLDYMLEDSQADVLVTNNSQLALAKSLAGHKLHLINMDELDVDEISENPKLQISPTTLAYILYTSGSTGQPKGVMQNHRNVLHFIRVYTNNLHIGTLDKLTLLSSYSFDAAVMDIFGALLNGATLYPIDIRKEGVGDLAWHLNQYQISIYHSTPTVYRHFLNSLNGNEEFPSIRLVVLGGEAVVRRDIDLYKTHFSSECVFVNGLGPTESTVSLQYFVDKQTVISQNAVPVGYPVDETEIILLNEAGEEVRLSGEIAIRSPYVALGYWGKPEMTHTAFLLDSKQTDKRIYRTGDMGRLLPDDSIEFSGRKDFQVKIRGHRVETGEIETHLARHPMIQECVVNAREDAFGDKRLVAYFVCDQPQPPASSELRHFLRETLPDYMIPAYYMPLGKLPLTPTGKIDRRALPEPELTRLETGRPFVAPRNEVEGLIASIWANVLGLENVSVEDNFFDLGGQSILATQVVSRIRKHFQINLSLRELFMAPTVAQISETVETIGWATQPRTTSSGISTEDSEEIAL